MHLGAVFLLTALHTVASLQTDALPYPRSISPSGSNGPVFVIDTEKVADGADKVTLQTLAGVLARNSPQIYTTNGDPKGPGSRDTDTTVFWLTVLKARTKMTFSDQYASDFTGLLKHFLPNVTGYAMYDPQTDSTNAALIRCAAEPGNVIAVGSPATAKFLESHGVKLVANVSASNPYDEFMSQRSRLNNRMACFQPDDGSKSQSLSDYAVFGRIPTVEDHSGGSKAFTAVLENFNKTHINAGLGWTSWDEVGRLPVY
jgi:hypothetical protein